MNKEMKRPIELEYTSQVAYTRALEKWVDKQLAALPIVEQEPVAWDVYVEEASNGYLVDDLDDHQLIDDLTNHNAVITPLYSHQTPAEVEALRDELETLKDIHKQTVDSGIAGFDAIVAENAALKLDAERYRWLRHANADLEPFTLYVGRDAGPDDDGAIEWVGSNLNYVIELSPVDIYLAHDAVTGNIILAHSSPPDSAQRIALFAIKNASAQVMALERM